MKLEFLYTDDSYKGKIHDIKLEDSVILSHTNKSGLFIFSYEVKGENKDSARILSNIKSQVEKLIDKEKCFLLNDGASEYYNKQLYPLYNWFERELRQVIAMAAVQDGKEKTKKLAHDLEGLDFGGIYKALFTSQDFWENFKNIKRDKPLSKKDLINRINAFEEKILWDEMFTSDFSFLPDNFDKIREFRNDVMHAHNISFEKFKESKNLIENAIIDLDRIKGLIINSEVISDSLSEILDILVEISKKAKMVGEKLQPTIENMAKFAEAWNDPNSEINKAANAMITVLSKIAEENTNG